MPQAPTAKPAQRARKTTAPLKSAAVTKSARTSARAPKADAASVEAPGFDALKWRCIGPPRGGRVVAVAGDPRDAMTFYFGACAGGVWKTTDGGVYWRNVSDGFLTSATIGANIITGGNSYHLCSMQEHLTPAPSAAPGLHVGKQFAGNLAYMFPT